MTLKLIGLLPITRPQLEKLHQGRVIPGRIDKLVTSHQLVVVDGTRPQEVVVVTLRQSIMSPGADSDWQGRPRWLVCQSIGLVESPMLGVVSSSRKLWS